MSNDTQPEIRFPGFTEAWEQRKLSDVASIVGGGTPSTSNPEYWDGDIDWYAPAEIGDQIYVNKSLKTITELGQQKSSAKILPIGTVLFTSRAGIGNTAILAKEGTTNQGFQSIVPHENKLDSYFIFSRTHELKRYGEVTGAGSTFAEVSGKQMAKMPILIPYIDEQRKIGAFFGQIDEAIALHQRKLDLLKETKKGFLQKMFPKNGAKVPEIRFPGFTKDWEERKLGDVFSERSERSSEGELISVTINSGVIKASELDRKDNSSDNKSNYKKVEVGDIAYNSMRMWQGASGYSSYEGILSPAYTVIIPKEGTDSKFFAYDFKRYDMIQTFKRNSQGLTSDTWNLKFPTLKLVKIMVPSIEEQKQIAAFFERLDNTIALHERELDVLKETKKGFLQKMFV
ncbi:restriction endonuclease subunit S [Enterococcus hirae]|uniref:restriction endonuclease subunit S n=1 Tax=Enterococcus hirae TaxID=1354 RepID=UPI0022207D22|nr:restriction endonuclease subunit S [Enterococcus hirae]UYT95334.1 restriction endonuclease subunit S [Enterococcus hirae]UYT97918.1 restriction endonuclease subunit S [Enterococcus hirae]